MVLRKQTNGVKRIAICSYRYVIARIPSCERAGGREGGRNSVSRSRKKNYQSIELSLRPVSVYENGIEFCNRVIRDRAEEIYCICYQSRWRAGTEAKIGAVQAARHFPQVVVGYPKRFPDANRIFTLGKKKKRRNLYIYDV